MGNSTVVDSMVHDGLGEVYNNFHMGMTGELVAEKHSITREQQDEFAVNSHKKAAAAWRDGRFDAEVLPVEIPAKKKGAAPDVLKRDDSIREDASMETLGALRPAFKPQGGTVTAGNAPGVNDAAAALVVMSAAKAKELGCKPMATIRAQATSVQKPQIAHARPRYRGAKKFLRALGGNSTMSTSIRTQRSLRCTGQVGRHEGNWAFVWTK